MSCVICGMIFLFLVRMKDVHIFGGFLNRGYVIAIRHGPVGGYSQNEDVSNEHMKRVRRHSGRGNVTTSDSGIILEQLSDRGSGQGTISSYPHRLISDSTKHCKPVTQLKLTHWTWQLSVNI